MKYLLVLLWSAFLLVLSNQSACQVRKIDSTLKMGKSGYRVTCSNKNPEQNEVSIKPQGFEKDARDMNFYIKGRITKTEIDDLNNDGFPDLVIYILNNGKDGSKTVIAFVSDQNNSIVPVPLPDIMLDGKLNQGYKGHDEFMLLEGKLYRQFPIYQAADSTNVATGKRVIQYDLTGAEGMRYQFKVGHVSDVK
jgi:hypothetical protein